MNFRVGDLNKINKDINLLNDNISNMRLTWDKEKKRGIKLIELLDSMGMIFMNGRAMGDNPANFT